MQVYVSVLKWGTWGWSWISDRKYFGGLGIGHGSLTGSTFRSQISDRKYSGMSVWGGWGGEKGGGALLVSNL